MFDLLKNKLITAPVLIYPDFNREFFIHIDASLVSVGGVLSQIGTDSKEHPIKFCLRTLNDHERNYAITKYKSLAVIYSYK